MALVLISDSLERLDYLQGVRDWSASVNDHIQTLKMELKFLQVFYKCREVKQVWDNDVINQFKKIEAAIKDVGEVILLLHVEAANGDLDLSLFSMLEKIELIKPVVDRCYLSLPRYSILRDTIGGGQMIELIDCVLENLKDLLQSKMNSTSIVGMNKSIDTLERKLIFQRYSLEFTDKLGILDSIPTYRDIEQWIVAAEDHFPRLEKVVVHKCKQLEEIPSSVGNSNTILMIVVKWCNTSAANSARDIYMTNIKTWETRASRSISILILPMREPHHLLNCR